MSKCVGFHEFSRAWQPLLIFPALGTVAFISLIFTDGFEGVVGNFKTKLRAQQKLLKKNRARGVTEKKIKHLSAFFYLGPVFYV